jgi:hemoglobin
MCDFWENTLFFSGTYKGNPMTLHQHLNKVHALDQSHFNRWLLLFTASIDKQFKGANASIAKRKAKKLANILSGMVLKA